MSHQDTFSNSRDPFTSKNHTTMTSQMKSQDIKSKDFWKSTLKGKP
jgi:hypothetical protein